VTSIHLVMEMAPLGELFAKLSEEGGYKESQAKGIFAQVASAVEYMVKKKLTIFHQKLILFIQF